MHQRGHVQELHRRARGHQALGRLGRAEEDQHRPEPLSAGRERAARVARELLAVALRHLREPRLGALEQIGQRRAARRQHRAELCLGGVQGLLPAWMAMMPPAVRIQRTSASPAAAIRAASSSGPGKRRTLLGR